MNSRTKKLAPPRCQRQQWLRDVCQRLTVVLMLVMLTTVTARAQGVFPIEFHLVDVNDNENYDWTVTINEGQEQQKAEMVLGIGRLSPNSNYISVSLPEGAYVESIDIDYQNSNDEPIHDSRGDAGSSNNIGNSIEFVVNDVSEDHSVNVTFFVHYPRYTVRFFANDGSGSMDDQTFVVGVPQNLSNCSFTREGYTFAGWAESENGNAIYTDGKSVTDLAGEGQTKNLYATWSSGGGVTYAVTFDKQGGSGGTSSVDATYNASMPPIEVPTLTNYVFDGYFTQANGQGTKYYNADGSSAKTCDLTEATTLYAKWVEKTYTVTLIANGGSGGTNSVTVKYGESMPAITVPSRTGYTFMGYYGDNGNGYAYYSSNGNSVMTYDLTTNTSLYARWTVNTYTVNLDPHEGSGGTTSVTVTYGAAMPSATMPTREGYTFGGYFTGTNGEGTQYYNANGTSTRTWNIDDNTTLHAKWTANTCTITFVNWDGTTVLQSGQVAYGQTPAYTGQTPTKEDDWYIYTFTGWTPSIEAVSGPATYTAQFSSVLRTSGNCGQPGNENAVRWDYDTDTKTITIAGSGPMMYYNSVLNDDQSYSNGAPWKAFAGEIESVIIENGVTSVGSNTFAHCPSISSVTLPTDQQLYEIGPGAFGDCTSLTSIDLPMSVNNIGDGAFAGCSNLATVRLGYGDATHVVTIGKDVFPVTTTIIVPNETAYNAYMNAATWNGTATGEDENKTDYTSMLAPSTITLAGNTSGWTTYCHKYNVSYSVEDGAAYTVSGINDSYVETATAQNVAPYTPTLVYKENGGNVTLTALPATATQDVPTSGYDATTGLVTQDGDGFTFVGATTTPVEDCITDGQSYALYGGEFLKIDDSTLDIPAHRCVLTIDEPLSAPRLNLNINGETTPIDNGQLTIDNWAGAWYTLDGRKLQSKPTTKGLYIYKGKKVVIK